MTVLRTPNIVIKICELSLAPRAVNVAPRITCVSSNVFDRVAVSVYVTF